MNIFSVPNKFHFPLPIVRIHITYIDFHKWLYLQNGLTDQRKTWITYIKLHLIPTFFSLKKSSIRK